MIIGGVPYRYALAGSGRVHLVDAAGDTLCHIQWRGTDPWFTPHAWPTVAAAEPTCSHCADAIDPANDHRVGYRNRAVVVPSGNGWPS